MRVLRTLLAALGALLLSVAAGGAASWLPTGPVGSFLAGQLSKLVPGLSVSGVQVALPFKIRFDTATLADADGVWLKMRDLVFDAAPQDLLAGRLTIRSFTVAEADVLRPRHSENGSSFALSELTNPPIAVDLQKLELPNVDLAPSVLGEAARVAISGAAKLGGGKAETRLAVQRTDGPAGSANLDASVDGERLKLALDADEPSGVLLDRLLGRTDHPPLRLALKGEGPLKDWHGTLDASAGDLAQVQATLSLATGERDRLAADGTVSATGLLPGTLAPLVGQRVPFRVAVARAADGSLALDGLSLDAAAAEIQASGTYAPDTGAISGKARLAAADLAPFSELAGAPLAGRATLAATLSGTAAQPVVAATLDGTAPRYGGFGADRLALDVTAKPDLTDAAAPIPLSGSAHAEGIVTAGGPPPAGLGSDVRVSFMGTADRSGRIELRTLDAQAPGVTLAASGTIAAGAAEIDARLAAPDLAHFAALAGNTLAGSGELSAHLARAAADGALMFRFSGRLADFATGTPTADALFGRTLSFSGEGSRAGNGAISIEKIAASGADLAFHGKAALSPDMESLTGSVSLDVPRLRPLGAALGREVAGRATLAGDLSGRLAAPIFRGRLTATDLVVAGTARLDRVAADLSLHGGASPGGSVDGRFGAGKLAGSFDGAVVLRNGGATLSVPKLRLAAAGSALHVSLDVALATGLATGRVEATVPDLGPWSALVGRPLAGRVALAADLGAKRGQTADVSLRAAGLSLGGPGTISNLAGTARFADLLGTPTGHAELDASGIGVGGGRLEQASLRIDAARPGRFAFTGETRGHLRGKLEVAAAGDVGLAENGFDLRLTRLDGAFAGQKLRLDEPLVIARRGGNFSFADLALALGPGRITGDGALKGSALSLQLVGEHLPVALAGRLAGAGEVGGSLDLDAALSGTLADPRGRILLHGRGLRFAAAPPGQPALAAAIEAHWRDGRVEAEGRVDGPKGEAIGFSASAPLVLREAPFGLKLPSDGAIAVKLEGDGELANWADLLPLGEDRVSGRFHLAVAVGGTVGAPTAGGRFEIAGGRYESLAAGTVLNAISLELDGDRDRFVLRRFSATDGAGGRVSGSGAVLLAATPGPAIDFAATLDGFRAVQRDEATASISGGIRLGGTIENPRVTARLRVEQAELRVPEQLPARIRELDPIQINSLTGQVLTPRQPAGGGPPAITAALDVTVDAPNRIFVRGRGLDSEWRGHLAVTGTSARPEIVGQLAVVRGTYSFLGKDFRLTSGTVSFNGGHPIEPQIDILAEARSADITAQVRVTGSVSQPTLTLTSQPALPQDEILSRVLFGRGVREITPVQGIQLAQTAASLAGGGPSVLDRIRGTLGLDVLEIGSGETTAATAAGAGTNAQPSGVGGATISAGKYVAEGVYLGVDQSVSGKSKAKVEVELTPHITLETDVGSTGNQGIGLNWKFDY